MSRIFAFSLPTTKLRRFDLTRKRLCVGFILSRYERACKKVKFCFGVQGKGRSRIMSSLRDLQHSLALRMEEVKQRDSLIQHLEREIRSRDAQIKNMQAELDKFKQILKPMTQQLAQNLTIQAMVMDDDYKAAPPGRDGNSGPSTTNAPASASSSSSSPIGLSTLGSGFSRAKEKVEA